MLATSLTAGAACLITGTCLYHMALDAHTDKSGLLKPSPHANPVPQRHPLDLEKSKKLREQYQDVEILSFDHLKLHGYLCTQKGSSQDTDRWAILVHGYDDSGLWFHEEALAFYRQGFHLLLPDARGHGKSQGTYVGMGWHDRLDIINWIYWIIRQDSRAKIVLYGVSMGAAAVMMAAGEPLPDHVKAAMEDCGYTSAWDVLKYQLKAQFHLPAFPALTCAGLMTRLKAGYGLKEADALKSVSRTKLPILFIHGTEDRFVPFEMCRMLYDACKSEKEYLAVEGAVHVRSAMVGGPAYWNKVFQFINSYI
ncbi:alpha/beta hydrolase [Enterocloster citroniae]|uniref:Fermentation-respiration switch protein FrsA (DUF1100 family) n=2 Tax=Enterocloster citroniae TaxID=358743 RepID=A0ABV2G1E3_9FIRM|nr:alpha/beta hydrolase [Enterocloster citroniae]KMW13036.1 hypothetical protein HMPREF9470_05208 [[Clostridium] citroniae WAL-19142]